MIARRCRMDKWTKEEKAIRDAVVAVEGMGADILLTDAVCLLLEAQKKVADFVDKINENESV